ncbi:unnamed protein product [marine sediment metagenome]|uniref:Uncharacterized protein n=1 Tax=marine sediment metagenome TaxID=412755 RepID=X1C4D1_9ZZZZ
MRNTFFQYGWEFCYSCKGMVVDHLCGCGAVDRTIPAQTTDEQAADDIFEEWRQANKEGE